MASEKNSGSESALPSLGLQRLGQEIKRLREQKAWTQDELAVAVKTITGKSLVGSTVGHWENARHKPPRASIYAMEQVFDLSRGALVDVLNEPDSPLPPEARPGQVHISTEADRERFTSAQMEQLREIIAEELRRLLGESR